MELDSLMIIASVLPLILVEESIPQHKSVLTGHMCYNEIMKSPCYRRFMSVARMDKETFLLLMKMLTQNGNLIKSNSINVGQKS